MKRPKRVTVRGDVLAPTSGRWPAGVVFVFALVVTLVARHPAL